MASLDGGEVTSVVALSLVMSTARADFPIVGEPAVPLFTPTIESLRTQTSMDFELIIVDALHAEREAWFPDHYPSLPFPVKHVPPKPGSWVSRGWWGVCGGFNTGIVHADGEFVCVIGDCSEFLPNAVEIALWHLRQGRRPMFGFQKMEGTTPRQRDIRLDRIMQHKTDWLVHQWADQFYGYSCCTLEDCLKVNGYDERFDGSKSLEDCDFGLRLQRAVGRLDFVLDKRLTVVEHEHEPIPERVIPYRPAFKTNYPLFLMNTVLKTVEANRRPFSEREIAFLRDPPTAERDNRYAQFAHYWSEFDWDGPEFQSWLLNPAIFDLREQRRKRIAGENPWT